jgi:EAL domain-containing protein (putative c-di-GMP-specific phosphodiesterase class I)
MIPDDGADAVILFMNTEATLKKAKLEGHRYLFYTQQMTETVAQRLNLENQLRQALDKEEFVLHYQLKVNLASGEITGGEALIRWNDPRTGLVSPDLFIPTLEETGLIYDVGLWALHQALRDYLRWRDAGLHAVRIAVNVSPLQMRHPRFIAVIEQIVVTDPLAAQGLEMEITEGMIMIDMPQVISIAIDDH